MRSTRALALLLIIGAVVAAFVIDAATDDNVETTPGRSLDAAATLSQSTSRGSTWFCVAATGNQGGSAESLVLLSNTNPFATSAVVSVYAGDAAAVAASQVEDAVLELPAQSTTAFRPRDLVDGPTYLSVAIEVESGGVLVEKQLSGPTGVDRSACLTSGATDWTVAGGDVTPGASNVVVVFNPFPDDAVLDIRFATEAGTRSPQSLAGVHVPARSSRAVLVEESLAATELFTTFVSARQGRVIVESLQSFDGTLAPVGLSALPGSPIGSQTWYFASVEMAGLENRLVLANPGEESIAVVVQFLPGDGLGTAEPFELDVSSGQRVVLDLTTEPRIAGLDNFGISVITDASGGLVASIDQRRPVPDSEDATGEEVEGPSTGYASSLGQPALYETFAATAEVLDADDESVLSIRNPDGDAIVSLSITTTRDGASRTTDYEVGKGRTLRLPLTELTSEPGRIALRIEASDPVTVSREVKGLTSRSWLTAVGQPE